MGSGLACEISVPQPGSKPSSPALQWRFLSTGHGEDPVPKTVRLGTRGHPPLPLAEAPGYGLGWYWWPSDQAEQSVGNGGKWSHHTMWSPHRKRRSLALLGWLWGADGLLSFRCLRRLTRFLWFHRLINSLIQELVQIRFLSLIITSPNWFKEEPSNQRHLSKNNFCMKNHTAFEQRPKCKATRNKTLRGKCKQNTLI